MKFDIIDKSGKKVGDYEFKLAEDVREDIFKKAVRSESSLFKQGHGASSEAGRRQVINVSKRRRKFRGTYGKGISRTPRKSMWRRGVQLRFVGAFAPNTVGGRKAHPPKASKIILKDMNNKEWLKALKSGVMASLNKDLVSKNGQKVPKNYPLVLDDSVEKMDKTKDFKEFLEKIGFADEIERTSIRKVRAGKGTMRNRTYTTKRGPLVVVPSVETPLLKAARNVKGFDVITPELLMCTDFGMSSKPGRAVVFTKAAFDEFAEVLN